MKYTSSLDSITPDMLTGFFDGWPNPPSPETHLRLLKGSDKCLLAIDETENKVVGFITAISDGVLSAYIPLLEVVPEYKNQGIGKELVTRMLDRLKDIYMVDLLCDVGLQPYYEKLGMRKAGGMFIRNYAHQSGN